VLEETSNYYLLAWRPNNEEQTSDDFKRIKVRFIDHLEHSVRLPRGFLKPNAGPASQPRAEAQTPAQSHRDLQQALTTLYPKAEIPTSLSLVFLDMPVHGPVLTASVRVANDELSYEVADGRPTAAVD